MMSYKGGLPKPDGVALLPVLHFRTNEAGINGLDRHRFQVANVVA